MQVSPELVRFVAKEEGTGPTKIINGKLMFLPYYCAAGKPTIGYGRVISQVEFNRLKKIGVTSEEAYNNLLADLRKFSQGVIKAIEVELTQTQFDSLVSLAYNIGLANFRSSTLLKRVNAKRFQEASEQFGRWIYAKKRRLGGLVARRERERNLFVNGVY